MKKRNLLAAGAVCLLAVPSAHAAEPVSMEDMQKQIQVLTRQVEKLSAVVEKQGHVIEAQNTQLQTQGKEVELQAQKMDKVAAAQLATIAPSAGKAEASDVKISMKPMPKIESADGHYSFQPFGRVHLDTTFFADDRSDRADSMHFRRARIGFKGGLGEDFDYKAEFDFGGEAVNIKELYLAYKGFENAEIMAGNFKPRLGLEQNTSTNYMSFIENSPVTGAFTRDEIIGVAATTGGDNWSFGAGVFNEDAGVNNGTNDEAFSVDARGSVDLLRDSDDVLHVGLGGSVRTPNAVTGAVTVSAKPAGVGPNMVSTGAIANVDRSYVYGAELAGVFGPVHVQGEYLWNDLDVSGGADASFEGWYAQAGILLTGERRPYKGKSGNFDRIKPAQPFSLKGDGWGAFELVTRYDVLDLNDASAAVMGGKITDWTAGLNWYLNNNIRMMFNFVDVNTDGNAVVANDDPEIYIFRTAADF